MGDKLPDALKIVVFGEYWGVAHTPESYFIPVASGFCHLYFSY
jgi:hypothetical protein